MKVLYCTVHATTGCGADRLSVWLDRERAAYFDAGRLGVSALSPISIRRRMASEFPLRTVCKLEILNLLP